MPANLRTWSWWLHMSWWTNRALRNMSAVVVSCWEQKGYHFFMQPCNGPVHTTKTQLLHSQGMGGRVLGTLLLATAVVELGYMVTMGIWWKHLIFHIRVGILWAAKDLMQPPGLLGQGEAFSSYIVSFIIALTLLLTSAACFFLESKKVIPFLICVAILLLVGFATAIATVVDACNVRGCVAGESIALCMLNFEEDACLGSPLCKSAASAWCDDEFARLEGTIIYSGVVVAIRAVGSVVLLVLWLLARTD